LIKKQHIGNYPISAISAISALNSGIIMTGTKYFAFHVD
jgi:hypothetical protein